MPSPSVNQKDPEALLPLRWLELYGDCLYAYAMRRVRRPEIAEDMVQETLLAALQAWSRFEDRSKVRTWLVGILRKKISDYFRERYRDERLDVLGAEDDQLFNGRGKWKTPLTRWPDDPGQLAELREFRAVLDRCLAKLPARMSHLFLSRATGEVATAELCKELEISSENAWMLLHRARTRLRQCLTQNWFANTPRRSN
jgi:RNA polymerase sigma-70 factor (TIGR02943 family)